MARQNEAALAADAADRHGGNHLLFGRVLSAGVDAIAALGSERDAIIREAFETGTLATLGVRLAQFDERQKMKAEPVSYRPRWPQEYL